MEPKRPANRTRRLRSGRGRGRRRRRRTLSWSLSRGACGFVELEAGETGPCADGAGEHGRQGLEKLGVCRWRGNGSCGAGFILDGVGGGRGGFGGVNVVVEFGGEGGGFGCFEGVEEGFCWHFGCRVYSWAEW